MVSHVRGTKVKEGADLTQSRNAFGLILLLFRRFLHRGYSIDKLTDVVEGIPFKRQLAKGPVIRY